MAAHNKWQRSTNDNRWARHDMKRLLNELIRSPFGVWEVNGGWDLLNLEQLEVQQRCSDVVGTSWARDWQRFA